MLSAHVLPTSDAKEAGDANDFLHECNVEPDSLVRVTVNNALQRCRRVSTRGLPATAWPASRIRLSPR